MAWPWRQAAIIAPNMLAGTLAASVLRAFRIQRLFSFVTLAWSLRMRTPQAPRVVISKVSPKVTQDQDSKRPLTGALPTDASTQQRDIRRRLQLLLGVVRLLSRRAEALSSEGRACRAPSLAAVGARIVALLGTDSVSCPVQLGGTQRPLGRGIPAEARNQSRSARGRR